MIKLTDRLKERRVLLSDGAWGTEMQAKGLKAGQCGEIWNVIKRKDVLAIAAGYIDAGSDIILTNTFGANKVKLASYDLADRASKLNLLSAGISREAAGEDRIVLGSMGPSGKIIMMGDVSRDELYEAFAEQAKALEEGKVDGLCIETMTALDEALIAIQAARDNTVLEIACTFTFEKAGYGGFHTMMGHTVEEVVNAMKDVRVDVIGANCGNGIDNMVEIAAEMRSIDPDLPIMVQSNAGLPSFVNGEIVYRETPEYMASKIPDLVEAGANIIGGCCGTTAEHIREMGRVLDEGSFRI